jgi:hypothetical protein
MMSVRQTANILAGALLTGCGMLYRFPPEQYAFYPTCPILRSTHLYCPGCGATRALAALLHGRIIEALHYNPLMVALLPLFAGYFAITYWNAMRYKRFVWPQLPIPVLENLLAAAAIFMVVRNVVYFSG